MIGNDIVDLHLAKSQSNWRRRGFLQKIFTVKELQQILNSEDIAKMIWLFWSMKEAAYKAWQRKNNLPPKFNPRSLECFLQAANVEPATGKVLIKKESFFTKSYLNSRCIHSLATGQKDEKIIWKSISSRGNLKQSFLQELAATTEAFSELPELKKNRNFIPQLHLNGRALSLDFSLTHHGNFSGFAFPLNNS